MTVDLSKLNFWSGANYMKRVSDDTPYTDVSLGSFGSATLPIAHNLGFIPEYDVQAELQGSSGAIWTGNRPWVGMAGAATPEAVTFDVWVDTANLTIKLSNPNSGSITVRVYHIIYKDYS